jgi:hypothetical protein
MKERKRKLTLKKEEIANLSNLSQRYVVGGTIRRPGRRVVPCDTQDDCETLDPCSVDGTTTGGGDPDDKEVTQQT